MRDWLEGPDPSDPPEDDDHDPLASVAAAIGVLAAKLEEEPELPKDDARLLLKITFPEVAIFFRTVIWPEARRLAGLPPAKPGPKPGIRPSQFLGN